MATQARFFAALENDAALRMTLRAAAAGIAKLFVTKSQPFQTAGLRGQSPAPAPNMLPRRERRSARRRLCRLVSLGFS